MESNYEDKAPAKEIPHDARIELPRRYIVQDDTGVVHTVSADDSVAAKKRIEPAKASRVALLGTHEAPKQGVKRVGWKTEG